jgi:SecA DEAD-like domain
MVTIIRVKIVLAVLIAMGASSCAAFQMIPTRAYVTSHHSSWTIPPSLSSSSQQQQSSKSRRIRSSSQLPMGLIDDFMAGGDKSKRKGDNERYLATLQERVARINGLEETMEDLGDDELAATTEQFRKRLQDGEAMDGPILEQAFAVVREAAWYVFVFGSFLCLFRACGRCRSVCLLIVTSHHLPILLFDLKQYTH